MKISIIGTGNVALSLGKAFINSGHSVSTVYGRNIERTAFTAAKLNTTITTSLKLMASASTDLILIAVNDDAIIKVAKELNPTRNLVVHTSGSIGIDHLKKYHKRCGVFYPLQTFSSGSKIDYKKMPLCIESVNDKDLSKLFLLANSVSAQVFKMNSSDRLQVHLAAVIANNFSNHLFVMAEKILKKNNISFDLLRPIILTAAKNIQLKSPLDSQTGPAKRHNVKVMNKHLLLLKNNPSWQEIYALISKDIQATGD